MSHNVRSHLQLGNDAYDTAIRRFIPGYEAMIGRAADAIAATAPRQVIELGAGTGALSEALLEREEIGSVELLDVDPEMMEQARERLARFGSRARFTERSYYEPFPPSDSFAASLSLHHIPTLEAKSEFFGRLFEALPPGGVFVNADASMPAERAEQEPLYRLWADHMVANGIAEDRAWQYFEEWSEEDTYLPLEDELAALAEHGFSTRCVWQQGHLTVVEARKP